MTSLIDISPGKKSQYQKFMAVTIWLKGLITMGLRIGKEITVINKQWLKGPVIIKSVNTQIAMGFGIARKIMVEM